MINFVVKKRGGPHFFASHLAHKDMYYKKQSCCPGNAYKNLCPISVHKVIIIFKMVLKIKNKRIFKRYFISGSVSS